MHCRAATFSFGSVPQDNPFKTAQATAPSQATTNGNIAGGEDVINLASDSSMTSPSEENEEVILLLSAHSNLHSVASVQYLFQ